MKTDLLANKDKCEFGKAYRMTQVIDKSTANQSTEHNPL